jgi:predicted Zn-dependent protease
MRKKFSASLVALSFVLTSSLTAVAQDANYSNKNALPEIGVVASDAISLDKEMIVGDAVMRQMRGQSPVISDPVLDEYLQDVGNRLVVHADNAKFPFEFFWVNNDAINAFAFFGGHIGVHTGLMRRAENESELASVLAHEISHVTQRHIARRMQAQQRSSPLALASLIGGVLIAMANPEAGIAAMQAGTAASAQLQIDYTRSNEQEADRIGIAMLARAGFDPSAAASFFSTMAEEYRMVSRPPARLLTHPLTETRIADARNRAGDYPRRYLPINKQFELAKARIKAQDVQRSKEASLYGLALAYMRAEKIEKAKDIMDELIAKDRGNLFYLDAMTDIYISQGEPLKAVEMLRPHVTHNPRNQVLALNQANAYISANKYEEAVSLLKDFLLVKKDYQLAHQLMSEAYQKSKRFSQMHQSKAEVYALYGAYNRAVDELQYAYNFAGDDHLEKQRIRARIKQFRDQEERLQRL